MYRCVGLCLYVAFYACALIREDIPEMLTVVHSCMAVTVCIGLCLFLYFMVVMGRKIVRD